MKYDLAKLMKKKLSKINKIKKKAFALPPIYFFGVEVIAAGAKSAAAAEFVATIGAIMAGVSTVVTAATIAYINNWDSETGFHKKFGPGSNPDIDDVMNPDIHNPSDYADEDNRAHGLEDYEEDYEEDYNIINITEEDLRGFGASEAEIMRIKINIDKIKKEGLKSFKKINPDDKLKEREEEAKSLTIYSIAVIQGGNESPSEVGYNYLYFRNKSFADNFALKKQLPDGWQFNIPGVRLVSERHPEDVFEEVKAFFCEPEKEIALLDTCNELVPGKNILYPILTVDNLMGKDFATLYYTPEYPMLIKKEQC